MENQGTKKRIKVKELFSSFLFPIVIAVFAKVLFPEEVRHFRVSLWVVFALSFVLYIIYVLLIKSNIKKLSKAWKKTVIVTFLVVSLIIMVGSFMVSDEIIHTQKQRIFNPAVRMLKENDVSDFVCTSAFYDPTLSLDEVFEDHRNISYSMKYSIEKYIGIGSIVVVPRDVKWIGEEAFSVEKNKNSISIQQVILPDEILTIHKRAFYKCYNMKSIVLPKSIIFIDQDAFDECNDMVALVYEDSYAQKYCDQKGIKYEIIQE